MIQVWNLGVEKGRGNNKRDRNWTGQNKREGKYRTVRAGSNVVHDLGPSHVLSSARIVERGGVGFGHYLRRGGVCEGVLFSLAGVAGEARSK